MFINTTVKTILKLCEESNKHDLVPFPQVNFDYNIHIPMINIYDCKASNCEHSKLSVTVLTRIPRF